MATRKPAKPDGTPKWVPIVGALVGVGGLVWAIASFFMPKAEAPKATSQQPEVQQSAVAGTGGTAINANDNSQVVVGATAPSGAAPMHASAPIASASQSARASDGGTAINAAGAADVQVNKR